MGVMRNTYENKEVRHLPGAEQAVVRPGRFRSLSSKFSIFTAVLVLWVVGTIIVFDARGESFDLTKGLALCGLVVVVAVAISRFTIRLLARPLGLLQGGIMAVRSGKLEPIRVSRTGDEIEFLGDSFNKMIAALAASHDEIGRHQEQLEDRIRHRTEELETAMHRALAASQAKSEFLANVSHELRTPMNGVLGMIDVVLDSRLSHEQRDHLETAQRCAYSLLAIVNDILDLSKIEAGKMALDKIPFEVRRLMDDCVKVQGRVADEKGVAVECVVDEQVPAQITGDPLRIRQIVSNLMSNAVKFTSRGRVGVLVSAQPSGPGIELRIRVEDTGEGIPVDKLPHIFEKFTQADGSISRKYGGTGLGLAITRKLAEMHGGGIEVQSTVGLGSAFEVWLMCEMPGATLERELPDRGMPAATEEKIAGTVRVMVVEDNIVNQKVVAAILRKRGFETKIAQHGGEALDFLRVAPSAAYYSVVLMDVQMPVLDGLEATRSIRADERWVDLPIIAMTAHAMNGDRDRCLQAGMNAYVSKPVNAAHLVSTIERYVRRDPRFDDLGPRRVPVMAEGSLAANLEGTDSDLLEGMIQVFLQLAPERIQRLAAAARRGDPEKLVEEAQKIASAAQRIAAAGVSDCTREISTAAASGDYDRVREQLGLLSEQIALLQQSSRPADPVVS